MSSFKLKSVQTREPSNVTYFPQLTGLKMLALLGVFCWHVLPQDGLPDLGARLVEVFFVVSGFLVGLRRHGTFGERISDCWGYVWPKIKALYPVYLIGLLLGVVQRVLEGGWVFNAGTIIPLVWGLGLQQAWVPDIAMMYNGAAWFVSAWAFCMFCAPILQKLLCEARRLVNDCWGLVLFFSAVFLLRVFLECSVLSASGAYPYSLHTTPFVRLLDFGLSYAAGVTFRERDFFVHSLRRQTLVAIAGMLVVLPCVIEFDDVWPRWAYVLIWIFLVTILAGGGGLLGRALSWRPLVLSSRIEMEFFLLHNPMIGIVGSVVAAYGLGGYKIVALVSFVSTVVLSLLSRKASSLIHGGGRIKHAKGGEKE